MSENWDFENKQNAAQEPSVEPAEQPQPAAEPVAQPQQPVTEPAVEKPTQPAQPTAQPQQPPLNGWSPDGGYRYVPPRPQQPTPPPYQPPYGGYNTTGGRYQSPAGGRPYTPPTQPVQTPVQPQSSYTPVQPPKPPRKRNGWIAVLAVLGSLAIVATVVVGAYVVVSKRPDTLPSGNEDPSVVDGDTSTNHDAPSLEIDTWDTNDGGLSTEEIVNRNYDSTVVLTAYSRTTNFYFGESNLVEAGGSTGIVMTEDGYIITNRHCVVNEQTGKNYDRVDVTTYDGTVYEDARIIGSDEATDLAVIKVEATDLTPAQFGDSDELAVGARVVALGNAAGLSWTATQGIVSAKARDVYDDTGYAIKCLQVDLAINYGNSGGPLLNKQGLVVGINSAKIAATGYEGLGFSIPINEAKVVIDSLLKNGYVQGRVALGITGQTVSSGDYKGFMIISIEEDSCLKETAAQVYDLIVAVDGVTVTDYGTLRAELAKHKVGDEVTLSLLRSDQRTGRVSSLTVKAVLREQKG
ncbi:MAG: trypsin-like peptidase domain-containing protein [Clostridia bacterium]|nr:trypsin-like peptidase domain-containing protein [Clostridia bacterium]